MLFLERRDGCRRNGVESSLILTVAVTFCAHSAATETNARLFAAHALTRATRMAGRR